MYEDVDRSELEDFDQEYSEAPLIERSSETIPDGKYVVTVDRVEITRAKKSGNPMLKWHLRILSAGEYRDRLLWRNNILVTPQNLQWLKSDLHLCGVDLVKLSELPDHLEKLLDLEIEINVRNKDDFCNIYLNKRLESDESDSPIEDSTIQKLPKKGKTVAKVQDNDDIPF